MSQRSSVTNLPVEPFPTPERGMDTDCRWEILAEPDAAWREARDAARPGIHLMDPWIAYRRARGMSPLYLLGRDEEGMVLGVGVAYESRSRWRPWKKPAISLDRLPWSPRDAARTPSWRGLLETARAHRWGRLEIDSFDGPSPAPDLAQLGLRTRDRFEFELDLTPPEDELWKALKASHRRKIRKAQKAGVEVEWIDSVQGIDLLRDLQGHTQSRRHERGEAMDCPTLEQYQTLAKTFLEPQGGRVLVGRHEGTPVTAILLGVTPYRAYYLMGGTSPAGLAVNSASAVMWEAIRRLNETNIPVLNLGGVPQQAENPDSAEHGLYRFKEGWGATRCWCRSGDGVL